MSRRGRTNQEEIPMERIRCELGENATGLDDVRAAVARCRESGAELELVGIVRTSRLDPPQPAFGERVRRLKHLQRTLEEAVRIAGASGLKPVVSIREHTSERQSAQLRAGAIMRAPTRLARRFEGAGRTAPLEPGR
jgi:hypothetical protein